MPVLTKWAASIALLLTALAIGGGAMWQRRHPQTSIASLAEILPAPAGSFRREAMSGSAARPEARGAPTYAPEDPRAAPRSREADREPLPPRAPVPPVATSDGSGSASMARPRAAPHFDIVRVEPKGETIVAGAGAPRAKVALLASGKVVAEARADEAGQFVLLPPPLAPGNYELTLRQTPDDTPGAPPMGTVSVQSVAVSVPAGADKGRVVVALAEPGRPTRLLAAPPEPLAAATGKPDAPKVVPQSLGIRSVELENGNGFYATGSAKPGTPVHLYLNDTHLADVVAGADGAWSVTIRKGLAGGRYKVRADAGPGATVSARAEVPFDVPAAMADGATAVSPADGRTPSLASLDMPRSDTEMPQAKASADRAKSTPTMGDGPGTALSDAPPASRPTRADASAAASAGRDATPDAARAVIDEVRTKQVLNGDNLWKISRQRLGFGKRFTQIYAANATQIRDPKLIYPGQVFVLPPK